MKVLPCLGYHVSCCIRDEENFEHIFKRYDKSICPFNTLSVTIVFFFLLVLGMAVVYCSPFPGVWQSFITIKVCRDCIPTLAPFCKKQLIGFFVHLLFFIKVKLGGGEELNLDQTGMHHRRLKFITLFWSGKNQEGYPVLELPLLPLLYCIGLYCIVLYCIILYCIVMYCIVLYCIVDKDHVYA